MSFTVNTDLNYRWVNGHNGYELVPVKVPPVKHLSVSQWAALEKAERPFYTGGGGGHAYTDVMGREDDDGFAYAIWWQCQSGVEMELDTGTPDHVLEARTAKRVAQVLAMMTFGPEILFR